MIPSGYISSKFEFLNVFFLSFFFLINLVPRIAISSQTSWLCQGLLGNCPYVGCHLCISTFSDYQQHIPEVFTKRSWVIC